MQINLQGKYERTKTSPTTRHLLCVFAAGDFERSLPRLEVDWHQVVDGVCQNGLIGLTQRYLEQHADANFPPPAFRESIQHAYRALVIRMDMLYRHIGRVLAQLEHAGIDYLVIKGPALAQLVYPDPMLRSFNDLDLIVREQSRDLVRRALLDNDFSVEKEEAQPPKLIPQLSTYETKYWNTKTNFLVEIHFDDLYNVGLASRDIDGFWQRAISVKLDESQVPVPSLDDQLVHACVHLHYHGYTRLNWLSDIAMIVRDHADQLNWDRVIDTARLEEIQVGVYYSLYFLERILGVPSPPQVLDALRPDRFRRWWHEYYLPEAKVISLQPMSRPIFSFYFVPLLNRLIPDLLIDGRRKEKSQYLLRLLFPPRDWLRYYYKLDHSPAVLFHYILHPLKLAFHYLTEIVSHLRARIASR